MSAILFGSISTIADTSELQRQSFNRAFKAHGLDWCWDRSEYLKMLENSGGQNRIADYADALGQTVDAEKVHRLKSKFFPNSLTEFNAQPRFGVVETIQGAKSQGLKIAFVTTTAQENISSLLEALSPNIQVTDFDLILNSNSIDRPKPDKAAYTFALEKLGEKPDNCIAIEDNLGGVSSAMAAGLDCIAFPNENTAHHDFKKATYLVDRLDFDVLQQFLVSK
jgi:HAD superfamily hydrolase (TIGR01509 family)